MNYNVPVFVGGWLASLLVTWVLATGISNDSVETSVDETPSLPDSVSAVELELQLGKQQKITSDPVVPTADDARAAIAEAVDGEVPAAIAADGAALISVQGRQSLTLAALTDRLPQMTAGELQRVWREQPALVQKLFKSALVSDDLVARNATIAKVLSSMTADNAQNLLGVFVDSPRGFHADNDYRLFLHAWGKLDGGAVMSYLLEQPDAHKVDHGHVWAMSGWAQQDPQKALGFLNGGEHDDVGGLYYGLIRGWARTDLDAAQTYLMGMENVERRNHLARVIGESYFEQKGAEGALAWATELAASAHEFGRDQRFAHQALGDVLRRVAANDPVGAASWVEGNLDEPYLQPWMFEQATNRLVKDDLNLAVGLMESVNARLLNGDTVRSVIGALAGRDGVSALDHAETLRPDLQRHAYGAAARQLGHDQLDDLGQWLENAPNEGRLDEARGVYAHRILNEDAAGAFAQIAQLSSTAAKDRVTYGLLQRVQHTNPELVDEWLPSMSEGARRKFVAEHRK
jgi:hypothetical protein